MVNGDGEGTGTRLHDLARPAGVVALGTRCAALRQRLLVDPELAGFVVAPAGLGGPVLVPTPGLLDDPASGELDGQMLTTGNCHPALVLSADSTLDAAARAAMARPADQRADDIVVPMCDGRPGLVPLDALFGALVDRYAQVDQRDPLTGLANRARFMLEVEKMLLDGPGPVTLVLLDLDRFKDINDALGEAAGDALLVEVGRALDRYAAGRGQVARLGQDEFAIAMADLAPWSGSAETRPSAELRALGEQIQQAVRGPFSIAGVPVSVEVGIGISTAIRVAGVGPSGVDASTLLRRADSALHEAKRRRVGVQVWSPQLGMAHSDDLRLLAELRQAIPDHQLHLVYQPLVDASTGRTHGVEALLRWQHPSRGLVAPGAFLPQAERSDVIFALTNWVLDAALGTAAGWLRDGYPLPVSVNVSAACLEQDRLAETVGTLLAAHGVPAELLTIEVTESAVMSDPVRAANRLTVLRELGARVSVDDFGTGYTSLGLLTQLPIDELKLDRTFVARVTDSASHKAVVRAVADLAHGLGVTLVGEGIEDEATAEALRALGFDLLQGFHLGRPAQAKAYALPARQRGSLTPGVAAVLERARTGATRSPFPAAAIGVPPVPLPVLPVLAAPPRVLPGLLTGAAAPRRRHALNALATVAAQLCDASLGLAVLVGPDRLEVAGTSGHRLPELVRTGSLWLQTLTGDGWHEVDDASGDPRFAGHPIVADAGFRGYAGQPIRSGSGAVIGVLSVLDQEPRRFEPRHRQVLEALAQVAGAVLAGREPSRGMLHLLTAGLPDHPVTTRSRRTRASRPVPTR